MDIIQIKFGHENFANYKRLAYKWWYALAEFVDNSTQSYLDNKIELDSALQNEGENFRVIITTDNDFVRVHDNAMGMSRKDLERALVVGVPPANSTGRCRYGLGLKTAACWIGDNWRIVTTKHGDPNEYSLEIDVKEVAQGNLGREVESKAVDPETHYTRLEIWNHHRPLRGRTIGKVKEYLRSIYRVDISKRLMRLIYNDSDLEWQGYNDNEFLRASDGTLYKRAFIFEVETSQGPKVVEGWAGVLFHGSRSRAGFSILHRDRLIRGWPDSWRPEEIYGAGGRNDLVNQRLVGEVNLEDFEVTHTKDDINWNEDEEEQVEKALKKELTAYISAARKTKKGQDADHGPSQVQVDSAVRALEEELATRQFLDSLELDEALPDHDQIEAANRVVIQKAEAQQPQFTVTLGEMTIKVYLDSAASPYDPYYVNEEKEGNTVIVVVNIRHPHWSMLEGENSVLNYMRHCVYDGVAEFRAGRKQRLEPDSIKQLKDSYLRVAFDVLQTEDVDDEPTE